MLDWITSRVDLVHQQANRIDDLKSELEEVRCDYEELKDSSEEAFEMAAHSISRNCDSLKSYVHEEIQDSQNVSMGMITNLQRELKEAREEIESLEKATKSSKEQEKCQSEKIIDLQEELDQAREVIRSMESMPAACKVEKSSISSLDSDPEREESTKIENEERGAGRTWDDFTFKFREAIDGKLPDCDASVQSKLDLYGTMTAEKLFQDLCFNLKSPSPQKRKEDILAASSFYECVPVDDEDEFLDARS